jgi:hypothetical protein
MDAQTEEAIPPGADIVPHTDTDLGDGLPGHSSSAGFDEDTDRMGDGDLVTDPQAVVTSNWLVYTDQIHAFQISYPSHFTVWQVDQAELDFLVPRPTAGVYFFDRPVTEELIANELPQLSLHIFEWDAEGSLEEWLREAGLLHPDEGWTVLPYQNAAASGVVLLASDNMAPGRFVYLPNERYVYQLVPLGLEGERMIVSFIPDLP